MSVRYLPKLDPDKWYVITTNHGTKKGRPWQEQKVSLHGPKIEASASWSVLGKYSHGLGFQFGRNGSDSDVGLDVYAGKLGSLWLRLRSPWTKWAKVRGRGDGWYHPRHTGLRLFSGGSWLRIEWDSASDGGRKLRREWSLTSWKVLGRQSVDREPGPSGVARVPLPEGNYTATYETETLTRRYVRWPGKAIDLLRGPKRLQSVNLSIEGGIPVEGKGDNSYDCGMDGLFGCSGSTVEEAVGNAVKFVLRDRQRYGGPHDLDRPMTVTEAEQRA